MVRQFQKRTKMEHSIGIRISPGPLPVLKQGICQLAWILLTFCQHRRSAIQIREVNLASALIFTDLDGTLLDHDSYSFRAAAEALAEIRRRAIPLILASSKTAAEIVALQHELGHWEPFICENGAAIFQHKNDGPEPLKVFARPRVEVLQVLHDLRSAQGYDFLGFADCAVHEIAELTGLAPDQAALAAQREYSEPLHWRDSKQRLTRFCTELAERGLQAQQGGRFVSVSSPCGKGRALKWLQEKYREDRSPITVALGDSPNDLDMLAGADIAVVIQSARSADMHVPGPARVIRSDLPGPRGWQAVVSKLLASGELG